MKRLFLKYYRPSDSGVPNKKWTTNVPPSDMYDLRIHLSWVLGMKVFSWTNEKIGRSVLRVYERSGELKFMINAILISNKCN